MSGSRKPRRPGDEGRIRHIVDAGRAAELSRDKKAGALDPDTELSLTFDTERRERLLPAARLRRMVQEPADIGQLR